MSPLDRLIPYERFEMLSECVGDVFGATCFLLGAEHTEPGAAQSAFDATYARMVFGSSILLESLRHPEHQYLPTTLNNARKLLIHALQTALKELGANADVEPDAKGG